MLFISMLFGVSFLALSQATQTVNICEHSSRYLTCPRGKVLDVIAANYGRTDRQTCPHASIKTTSCRSGRSLQAVKRRCHGQPSCKLYASNRIYGDPCYGTYKYLKVTYRCRNHPRPPRRSIVCEGRSTMLSCLPGYQLQIRRAFYGRTNRSICRHSAMTNIRCSSSRSLQVTRGRCNSRRVCFLPATNAIFGDPCRGTYKYLDITYQCV